MPAYSMPLNPNRCLQSLGTPWASLLTTKLNNQTRLVGPVITCQDISWPDPVPEAERRRLQPFLPQHMIVTDQVPFFRL